MRPETLKFLTSHTVAAVIIGGGFYALVLYPYQLDDLVKGAVISLMTMAAKFVFDDQQAAAGARRQQAAFDVGLAATPTEGAK